LTGAVLLAALLKDEQSVRLRFEGNGPLGKIITEAGRAGWVRGYVTAPQAEVPLRQGRIDVAAGLGRAGFLTVTKDIGMNHTYEGTVQLFTSEIAQDIAFYLSESEQVPSAVGLGVHLEPDGGIAAAGGFLVQSLPPADERLIAAMEERVNGISSITELLRQGTAPEAFVALLLADIPYHLTARTPLIYACSCSREKMEQAVLSLGREELTQMVGTKEETEVQCEFCRDTYRFSRLDLQRLLASGSQLH